MESLALHQQLTLYTTESSYTFAPQPGAGPSLIVHRSSGDITLGQNKPIPRDGLATRVYGIVGLLTLTHSEYIIVITGREFRGRLMGRDIFRASAFDVLPLVPNEPSPQHVSDNHLLSLVKSHLSNGLFWFSYTWDLTRRLQTQVLSEMDDAGKSLWETVDDRFFWNKFLLNRFINISQHNMNHAMGAFILPIIFGSFDIRAVPMGTSTVELCLISRRSRFRAGTRFFRRGVDHEGHVANFNETEQIVLLTKEGNQPAEYASLFSFVQIRGSIPLYWAEVNNLHYTPDLQIMEKQDSAGALQLHLREQQSLYGDLAVVNLLKQTGREKALKDAFEKHINDLNLPSVSYEYFDFHNECKHLRWDRVTVLVERVEEDLIHHGYFRSDASESTPSKLQMGVIRTNCLDNLDRTNVAQAAFAKWTLTRQLRDAGVFSENEKVDDHEDLVRDFRNMWADHADLISKAYSGTGALKTDFTRTGIRTKAGLLQDGLNSVMRYLKNNHFDGPRQDGYDLVTGSWMPRKAGISATSLLVDKRPLLIRSVPHIASFALFMVFAGLTLPRTSDYSLVHYFLLWITILTVSVVFVFVHGIDYVAWPRLNSLNDIINYDGPGFQTGKKGRGLVGKMVGETQGGRADGRRRSRSGANEIEMGTKKHID